MDADARHITLEACFNFRDLGGYPTGHGRRVAWGRVFRSDSLHRLSPADGEVLAGLGLRTVIDLRSSAEVDGQGRSARAVGDVALHHVPLFEHHALPFVPHQSGDPEPPPGQVYLAIANAGAASLSDALRTIADGEHAVVIHCVAGKDRTGLVAAVLLSLLGVADDHIAGDYELSDRAIDPARAWARVHDAEMAAEFETAPPWLMRSHPAKMHAFLDGIREQHGSVERFVLGGGLGTATIETLRDRLLEPVEAG